MPPITSPNPAVAAPQTQMPESPIMSLTEHELYIIFKFLDDAYFDRKRKFGSGELNWCTSVLLVCRKWRAVKPQFPVNVRIRSEKQVLSLYRQMSNQSGDQPFGSHIKAISVSSGVHYVEDSLLPGQWTTLLGFLPNLRTLRGRGLAWPDIKAIAGSPAAGTLSVLEGDAIVDIHTTASFFEMLAHLKHLRRLDLRLDPAAGNWSRTDAPRHPLRYLYLEDLALTIIPANSSLDDYVANFLSTCCLPALRYLRYDYSNHDDNRKHHFETFLKNNKPSISHLVIVCPSILSDVTRSLLKTVTHVILPASPHRLEVDMIPSSVLHLQIEQECSHEDVTYQKLFDALLARHRTGQLALKTIEITEEGFTWRSLYDRNRKPLAPILKFWYTWANAFRKVNVQLLDANGNEVIETLVFFASISYEGRSYHVGVEEVRAKGMIRVKGMII